MRLTGTALQHQAKIAAAALGHMSGGLGLLSIALLPTPFAALAPGVEAWSVLFGLGSAMEYCEAGERGGLMFSYALMGLAVVGALVLAGFFALTVFFS